ncbi:YraN family protein [Clostridium pasteurianum]|uniref:UPF0102 protein Clopa_2573 n=1 Tax=Clostridium pasteurianum BC1 TaxID=86416 RepID=R4K4B7_CLOPA|nr:YraN family protein [Clostridium pasteurianum]AGK97433.1 TIGR00252 family protein [Clostridium pasteurianum BC1]
MQRYNREIGTYGEDVAAEYLKSINYRILKRNYRCKIGEIDIIAKHEKFLCFTEVKTRYETSYGSPSEAVNKKKQFKIYRVAEFYIMKNSILNLNFRFDVVEVLLNRKDNNFSVRLIENAFQI